MIGTISQWLTALVGGENSRETLVDPGTGNDLTSTVFSGSGFDAAGLPGDLACVIDIGGGKVAIGFIDPAITPIAEGGEVVIYSRSAPGVVAAKIHLKNSGSIFLNGVEITPSGEVKAPGEVTAKAGTPAEVKVSTHQHPTAMGPSGPPTPGT